MRRGSLFFLWWIICFILVLYSFGRSTPLSFYTFISGFSRLELSSSWRDLVDSLIAFQKDLRLGVSSFWDASGFVGSAPESGWDVLGWLSYIGRNIASFLAMQVYVVYPTFRMLFSFLTFIFDTLSDLISILAFLFNFLLGSA